MSANNRLDKIREIIANATLTSMDEVNEGTSVYNLSAWDSVAQINVIVGIESEFDVSFSVEEMYSLNSVEKIGAALERATEDRISVESRNVPVAGFRNVQRPSD